MIFALFIVALFIFLRLIVAVMKRLLPQMVPQLMAQVGENIPDIKPKQAIGLIALEFVKQGGVAMLMEKFLGVPPPKPPGGQ